jgi:hypothetical protein
MGRGPAVLLLLDNNAPLFEQPVDPVLGCAAGNLRSLLDVGGGKKTFIERKLPHQMEEVPPALKHA